MAIRDYALSDNQDFNNLSSTGEVTDDKLDVELDALGGNTILTDDQGVGYMNVVIISAPAQATIAGTQGVEFQVRTAAAAELTSLYEICGAISVLPSKLVAGAKFSVPFKMDILQSFLGGWVKAINAAVVGYIYADIWFSDSPIGENAKLQKVPA